MLERYTDLPFVLIGDSGQHDPEVYAGIVHDHPGRVAAVYIRDVSGEEARAEEIRRLAEETAEAGSPLVLAGSSAALARHAVEEGILVPAAAREVARTAEASGPGGDAGTG